LTGKDHRRVPGLLFRKAKAAAAEQGASFKEFFTEAVQDRLRRQAGPPAGMPGEKAFGGLCHLHRENKRIERLVEAEFEIIDEDQWR